MANLEREIAVVRPRVIMALGVLPTRVLVGEGVSYEAALGKWHEAFGAPCSRPSISRTSSRARRTSASRWRTSSP
jgi:uracil-DNA glycosylase